MKNDIIKTLGIYLRNTDIVILVDVNESNFLTDIICTSKVLNNTDKRIAIISASEFIMKPCRHICHTVTDADMRVLLELYRSYEFSDKIRFLSKSGNNYGNIWNYLEQGMLSCEELLEAILA